MNLEPWWPLEWDRSIHDSAGLPNIASSRNVAFVRNHPVVRRVVRIPDGVFFDEVVTLPGQGMLEHRNSRFQKIFVSTGTDDLTIRAVLLSLAARAYGGIDDGIVYG
jgi:hypothetical protein